MKVVFVAFNCKRENSVMYKKVETLTEQCEFNDKEKVMYILGRKLVEAIEKDADFVSVRFIK